MRAWRIVGKSLYFAVPIAILLAGSLFGAIATTVLTVANVYSQVSPPSPPRENILCIIDLSLSKERLADRQQGLMTTALFVCVAAPLYCYGSC